MAIKGIFVVLKLILEQKKCKQESKDGVKYFHSIFGSKKEQIFSDDVVNKIKMAANFSAYDIDLSRMKFDETVTADIYAIGSAVCIRVPENVQVIVENHTKQSAISNNVPDYVEEEIPTLMIHCNGYFSAIAIKIKESEKE